MVFNSQKGKIKLDKYFFFFLLEYTFNNIGTFLPKCFQPYTYIHTYIYIYIKSKVGLI